MSQQQFLMIVSEYNGNAIDFDWSMSQTFVTHRCHGEDNQQFQLKERLDGHFVIALKQSACDRYPSNNACIGVLMNQSGGSSGRYPTLVNVPINDSVSEESQQWRLEMVEFGLFRIISAINGHALSMPLGTYEKDKSLSLLPYETIELKHILDGQSKYTEINRRQLWRVLPVNKTMLPYFSDREMEKYTFRYPQQYENATLSSSSSFLRSASGSSSASSGIIKSGIYKRSTSGYSLVIEVCVEKKVVIFDKQELPWIIELSDAISFTISWPAWGIARFAWDPLNEDVLVEKDTIEWRKSGTTSSGSGSLDDLTANAGGSSEDSFKTALKPARDCLEEHGFVVISDVYDAADIDRARELFGLDLMESVDTSICDQDENMTKWYAELKSKPLSVIPEIWKSGSGGKLENKNQFDGNKCGIAQGRCAWSARLSERVQNIYFDLYNTGSSGDKNDPNRVARREDLCVGMDRMFYSPKTSVKGQERTSFWPHADINPFANGVANWHVYQSVLYLWDSKGDNNASTVVWPGSHKAAYKTIIKELVDVNVSKLRAHQFLKTDQLFTDITNADSVKAGNLINLRFLSEGRRVSVRPGSLLIWSSRTIHQGWSEGQRLAVPLCFEPKNRRSEAARRQKLRLVALGLASTHWASLGIQHGDSVAEIDRFKPGFVDNTGDVVLLPTKKGGIKSFVWKDEVSSDQGRRAVAALEATKDAGETELRNLEALVKDEILRLL